MPSIASVPDRHRRLAGPSTVLWLGLWLLSGCGGPASVTSGVVRFVGGEPVRSGSVEFRSLATGSRYASRIAPDGTFDLTDADGDNECPPGKYEVVVVQIVLTEDLALADHTHGTTVPRRYADYYTSGLSVTTTADQTTPIHVVLTSEP